MCPEKRDEQPESDQSSQQQQDEEQVKYLPIPLGVMQPGTLAPVDLFIHVGPPAGYLLYKKARDELREDIRQRLVAHGVDNLYLRSSDEDTFHEYVEEHISTIIRDDLVPEEDACKLVYQASSRVMEDTFNEPRAGRNLRRAHRMVEATVQSIMKDPDGLWHMTSIASHDYYTYTHCVHVAMFLVAASYDVLGIRDAKLLRLIGSGGILHDIGKSEIPGEILNKPGKLTEDEFRKVKEHPVLGLNLVRDDRRLEAAAGRIIGGHHEHYDGGGYPAGLSGERIDRIVRLSTIVDVYDALTTNRCYAGARSAYKALDLMFHEMEDAFDINILEAFVQFLGPHEYRQRLRARWEETLSEVMGSPVHAG
ncbi:MAG: HD domain-containing phosphohydrolase [Candidatus Brocadiia bacterium]